MSEQKQNNTFLSSFGGATLGVIFGVILLLCCCVSICFGSIWLASLYSRPYSTTSTSYIPTYELDYIDRLPTYNINENITIGNIQFKVTEVSEYIPTKNDILPKKGYSYLKVDVTINNISASSRAFGTHANFRLLDSNSKYIYPLDDFGTLSEDYFSDGESINGFVVFEIPKGQTGFKLLYYGNYETTKVDLTRG